MSFLSVLLHINEQKPSTALKAAELAVDFVLTYKARFDL